jgi:DNA-binding transcriptional ArsR family regulator
MMTTPLNDQIIDEVSQIFGALGDVSRLKILRALLDAGEPLSQGAVMERTGLSQANTSKHLAFMVRVGLVGREPRGNLVYFMPVAPLAENVCTMVCGHVTARIHSAYQSLA